MPKEYYQKKLTEYNAIISAAKKRLFAFSMLRLTVFLAMCASFYVFLGDGLLITISLAVGFIFFFLLVSRFTDLKNRVRYLKKMVAINELELEVLNGDLGNLKTGDQYIFEEHHFNQDIDLFGSGSLFQAINRTELKNGEKQLAAWLNSNNIDDIKAKQEATEELSQKADWRQNYAATGSLIESDVESNDILKWVKNYKPFVPAIHKWFPILFSVISIVAIGLLSTGLISWIYLVMWSLLGFAITGPYFKKITSLFNITDKVNDTLAQYSKLLEGIENEKFDSELLQKWQNNIKTENVKASIRLDELSNEINRLSRRNVMIFGLILNGLFLWDLRYSFRIEKWLKEFDGALNDWFTTIENFDSINSFGNYRFNHPGYLFPEISSNEKLQLNAQDLGHPLLNPKSIVTNSIEVNKDDFYIITGANMAGKSTFLRTVAVNLVMANCGLPVCANSFSYRPVKLISSMRTSDSLMNDESYFFSELKRLKFIVDAIKTDTYFIILDEILKGTNSKDKAEGSQKFVEKLVGSKSTGLIATHDLSLCTLADSLPQIRNYYFDAEIVDNELFFDYTFKKGICQNMNASFLLKKMEIV